MVNNCENYIRINQKGENMDILNKIIKMIFVFEKEPQKVGLSQFKPKSTAEPEGPSIRRKDVKLSDLMRRAS